MKKLLFVLCISLIIGQDQNSMNYIIDNIYLGDSEAASNEKYLKKHNITAVVNCAIEHTSRYKDLNFLELKLYDYEFQNLFPMFEIAYKFIKNNSRKKNNYILIHCMCGISRSTSLVVFYLMKEKKWDYDTSINCIIQSRPIVSPNSGFERQLRNYYDRYIK